MVEKAPSDSRAEGWSFEELREAGRWSADSSLRCYRDIVGSSGIEVALGQAELGPALEFVRERWTLWLDETWIRRQHRVQALERDVEFSLAKRLPSSLDVSQHGQPLYGIRQPPVEPVSL